MTPDPDPKPLQYSALQLAWLHELGVDKPWLPGDARARSVSAPAGAPASKTAPDARVASVATGATVVSVTPVVAPGGRGSVSQAPRVQARGTAGKTVQAAPLSAASLAAITALTMAAARAAPDAQALAAAASACQACGLCRERQQVVMGAGVTQPAILVIGDGPAELDDRKGLPFLTESGTLLDNMLSTIGRARGRDVYLTNIVKCRPPGNRLPRPEEVAACKPYLLRQVELLRPFSILALGRGVAQSLLQTEEPLQGLRGRVHQFEVEGKQIPLVASYHPGHLLNHPADKAAAWQDLQSLRALTAG